MTKAKQHIDVRKLIPINDVKIFNYNRGKKQGKAEEQERILKIIHKNAGCFENVECMEELISKIKESK